MRKRLKCALLLFAASTSAIFGENSGWNLDIAPFGRKLAGTNFVGFEWPELRRVTRLEVIFAADGPLPAADALTLEYWHRVWNGGAVHRSTERGAGGLGWAAADDWFNGVWRPADSHCSMEGRTALFTFASSGQKEFPNIKTPGVAYRPTLKVRLVLPDKRPEIASLRIFSDSLLRESDLQIRFHQRERCEGPLEVYNGSLLSTSTSKMSSECIVRARLRYAVNPEDSEADRTIVTVRGVDHPFSFAVDEAERGDRIYVRDLGVLITRADDPVTIPEYGRMLQSSGIKTVYDRVAEQPEQTLMRAWDDMPLKRSYFYVLGCEGGRQRFRLDPSGDISVIRPNYANKMPGKDNAAFLWRDGMRYRFGLPSSPFADRFLAGGYLPIVTTQWLDGDLLYEQEAFADVLAANINEAPPMQADDPTVAFLRIRIVNHASSPRWARLRLTAEAQNGARMGGFGFGGGGLPGPQAVQPVSRSEKLRAEGDRIVGSFQGRDVIRYIADTRSRGSLNNSGDGVSYEIEIPGRAEHSLFLKIPFMTLTEDRDIQHLRALSPERERAEVARYWEKRVAAGSQIRTPEPWLNDFYRSSLIHLLINDERQVQSDRYAARVGSLRYGAFGNESIMMISDMDRRGYWKEAERSLDLFLHYQGSVSLPGAFSTKDGVLYGAGGFEAGGYNQHHGWILWGLAEHYRYTRDRVWMQRAAPHMLDACRWILNERKATQRVDTEGHSAPEFGLLPAGALEDVRDYWFWLSTNSFTWWGLVNAVKALQEFGHSEAPQLLAEAERYRQDILAAFGEAMIRSPVVRLRDGAYVPHFPSNVYTRGRSDGWIRETLEGAIMLPITKLLDPGSREAQWILKDYEDNLYISDKYGYSIPVFERFWFSRGGFSMQPNLLHGPLPYLYRDEIKHFIRAYLNAFAAGFDPGLRLLPEHPLPELGYLFGDLFKTSDEAQSAYWLRLMFVTEVEENLHLGRGIPRDWLRDGQTIGIRNARTYFGQLSYEIHSRADRGEIEMSLDPPSRNSPKQITVRFRHPSEKLIQNVTVNGAASKDFDAKTGDIHLPGNTAGVTTIIARY